ncbi:saccharopine dehydrogenase family protein [Pelosinus propionicus]|uniref:Saccharopine dehydrogenase, NADP-dependent n=1 Tax=Pelosinus propionicus DSM 13327 TaxID=1123291 RepID=A0A1I4JV27_9FIRM|nr:saccharopine dehydrogenase NADP-binding domain-containing protein [Pelosinus propionicus]SFL69956.1 Saccharopine dehydrogenase, NADP-dependent [Pelosinus propionicus DSM 13327]
MKDKIIVVGGYGKVGQIICKDLGELFPGKIFAAGRSYDKAKEFCLRTNGKVLPLQMDVHGNKGHEELFQEASLVVMCLDQQNPGFVERCLKEKIHYVDISASHEFLLKVKSLSSSISSIESTAVLSVGLAPGVTNVLVKHSLQYLDQIHSANIYLMLGLGEAHGRAAIEWMIDNMNTVFFVNDKGVKKQVRSFEDERKVIFPNRIGQRSAYRFNFTDQHVLPETLGIPSVSTRICFDSAIITNLIALLKKIGVLSLLHQPFFRRLVIHLFEKIKLGSEIYVAKVISEGIINEQVIHYECSVYGEKESYITGKVAAFVAKRIYEKPYPAGIFHMEELFEWEDLFDELQSFTHFEGKKDLSQ